MPPKRKRAVDDASTTTDETTTRSTRSTTKASGSGSSKAKTSAKGSTAKSASKGKAAKVNADTDDEEEAPVPAKKVKTSTGTTKKPAATKATTSKGKKKNDILETTQVGKSSHLEANHSTTSTVTNKPPEPIAAPTIPAATAPPKTSTESQPPVTKSSTMKFTTSSKGKAEPYSATRALALFSTYTDPDDSTVIAAEGFENLCNDAEIGLEGPLPMILSWQFNLGEMLKIRKEEWVKATGSLKISSLPALKALVIDLEDLLILNKSPLKKSAAPKKQSDEPYDRTSYWTYIDDKESAFRKLYSFCFGLAKPPQSRNIEMETSVAFWTVLLVPKYPIMNEVIAFITEKEGAYKATNKDLWSMMLEFCETVKPTLQDYESDGAWPTLLDDFVAWKMASS